MLVMEVKNVVFVKSSSDFAQCPTDGKPEYAFIGRSNVGKSSLINMLMNHKNLAKTSGRPGKTQLINHFLVDESWYVVDLPGYGYAKTSKSSKQEFQKLITSYLSKRENMVAVFLLIDSRLEPQKNDLEFMRWLGENQVPFCLVFTKLDKLSSNEFGKNSARYKKRILVDWEILPPIFATSAVGKIGRDEMLAYIGGLNEAIGRS
jgi:GTP-binding protein